MSSKLWKDRGMMKRRRLNCCNSNGYQDLHLAIPEYPESETETSSIVCEVTYRFV